MVPKRTLRSGLNNPLVISTCCTAWSLLSAFSIDDVLQCTSPADLRRVAGIGKTSAGPSEPSVRERSLLMTLDRRFFSMAWVRLGKQRMHATMGDRRAKFAPDGGTRRGGGQCGSGDLYSAHSAASGTNGWRNGRSGCWVAGWRGGGIERERVSREQREEEQEGVRGR